jgi:hypothetical protein
MKTMILPVADAVVLRNVLFVPTPPVSSAHAKRLPEGRSPRYVMGTGAARVYYALRDDHWAVLAANVSAMPQCPIFLPRDSVS